MRKMLCRMPALVMMAMAALPAPASAATIVYRLTGLFDSTVSGNGSSSYIPVGDGAFTGTGDTDDVVSGIGFSAIRLSSFTLALGGKTFAVRNASEFFVFPGAAVAGFGPGGGAGSVWITADAFRSYDPATALAPLVPSVGARTFSLDTDGGSLNVGVAGLRSFSATIDAAVPEPATWAMMIAGFALVGAALRRRTVVTATTAYRR